MRFRDQSGRFTGFRVAADPADASETAEARVVAAPCHKHRLLKIRNLRSRDCSAYSACSAAVSLHNFLSNQGRASLPSLAGLASPKRLPPTDKSVGYSLSPCRALLPSPAGRQIRAPALQRGGERQPNPVSPARDGRTQARNAYSTGHGVGHQALGAADPMRPARAKLNKF